MCRQRDADAARSVASRGVATKRDAVYLQDLMKLPSSAKGITTL